MDRYEKNEDMFRAVLTLRTVDECRKFFNDLCSISELRALKQRFQVAKYLHEGRRYSDILERTGASSATISRVNHSLRYGEGGYYVVFDRLPKGEGAK